MDMVDSALKTLDLALVKYNKRFKKYYRKNVLETSKKGTGFEFFSNLKKKIRVVDSALKTLGFALGFSLCQEKAS